MPDIGERYTDQALEGLRRRLREVYAEAQRDVAMKLSSFEHAHRERVKKHLAEVREGTITKADFEAWMRGQVFQREQWQKKQQQIAEIMTRVDEQAMAMLNDGKVDVFAENANFMGWDMESGAGADFGFGLYNRDAVKRLVRDDPDLLPRPKIDKKKDYEWYNRIVSDAVTHGILQGEALDDIMLRIANDSGERSINAMLRNARTAYTGAQNAGREMAMRDIAKKGIRVEKEWSAMMNAHTRDAHAELNGQHVPPDEPFDSILGPIMRPGDPTADPANVYNCHCCLKKFFPDYPDSSGERGGSGEDNDRNREAYERWKFQKGVGKDVKDVKKWLKGREKAKQATAKASASSKVDPLAGATWANGPRAGQKYGEEAARALTKVEADGIIEEKNWYLSNIDGKPEAEAKYKDALSKAKQESNIKGDLSAPIPPDNLPEYEFNDKHANSERKHNVTEEEARQFIREAVVKIERLDGTYVNYLGPNGSTYTIPGKKEIKTAFKAEEYKPDVKKTVEVMERELGKES